MDLEKDIKKCQSESNTIRSDDGFFLGINSDSAAKLCESISMESLPNNVILGTPEFVKKEN